MHTTTRNTLDDAAGLYFDADWTAYARAGRPRTVCRAAVVSLDLGEKLLLRLARPLPGEPMPADRLPLVMADRGQFLALSHLRGVRRPTAPEKVAGMTAADAAQPFALAAS